MKKLINKYRMLNFEDKTLFSTFFSILFNLIMASGKIVLSLFQGVFFLVSGIINLFMMMTKLECYLGVKYPHKKSFKYRNRMTSIFLILAGLEYSIYMARMIFTDVELMEYDMILGVIIAFVSFVEITIAIIGCFKVVGKGHYFRNIKIINLCSAMTAIVLTEVALMSFANEADTRNIDGMFGLLVGALIIILGVFVLIAPKISIVDKLHNTYKKDDNSIINEDEINIKLTNSKFYADFYYRGEVKNNKVDGYIYKGKNPILGWNIYIVILVIVLSEILIFPYAVGSFVNYIRNQKLVDILDDKMKQLGYIKIMEDNEYD